MKAVVIGAGIAGLATAALLLREGWDVVVVDKQESVGGRAGTLEVCLLYTSPSPRD